MKFDPAIFAGLEIGDPFVGPERSPYQLLCRGEDLRHISEAAYRRYERQIINGTCPTKVACICKDNLIMLNKEIR